MSIFTKIRDIICYCGLSKDEYRKVKKDAYVNNFLVWQYIHLFLVITFAVLLSVSFLNGDTRLDNILLSCLLVYSIVASFLFFKVFKPDSLIGQFAIYATMILLLAYGMYLGIRDADMTAATFEALLIISPVFMIDKPYFMIILLYIAAAVFLHFANIYKPVDVYNADFINVTTFTIFGMVINTFYNFIRVKGFVSSRQISKQLADLEDAEVETNKLNETLLKMSEEVVDVLGEVVESRDADSGEHIKRVKGYTYILAKQVQEDLPEYGLDDYKVKLITFSSALHDVGKISIPDSILLKPGALTKQEFEVMKSHCAKGADVIKKMVGTWGDDYLQMGLSICLNHHEKWDGKGYPRGLKGDEIPIEAQIVSIADIYDALTTQRVYKPAYTYDTAFEMIINGECGAFSDKLMSCFKKCKKQFENHSLNPNNLKELDNIFEITTTKVGGKEGVVVGIYDEKKTLQDKLKLSQEVSVMGSLAEDFFCIVYVEMNKDEVIPFKVEKSYADILDSFDQTIPSNQKFDKLLNTIILKEDYEEFRKNTDRNVSMDRLLKDGRFATDFRIKVEGKIHYCRMKIVLDEIDPNAVIIGMAIRDSEHEREAKLIRVEQQLENAEKELISRKQLEDRLAVINAISSDYDYVCSLDARTMDVVVYHAEDWIKNMFESVEDIVVSPEARNTLLKDIIHPDDFEKLKEMSMHENVVKALKEKGSYEVNYRGYKNNKLINYQTKYIIDAKDPGKIIIGLREVN